jgi:hypothetical protein
VNVTATNPGPADGSWGSGRTGKAIAGTSEKRAGSSAGDGDGVKTGFDSRACDQMKATTKPRCDFGACRRHATHNATWKANSKVTERRPLCTKHATGRGYTACLAGATVERIKS